MSRLDDLVWTRTNLVGPRLLHARRLIQTWRPVADLSFADLLLLAPITGEEAHRFIVCGQVRSTTGQTIYPRDMVATVIDEVERPLLRNVWERGETIEGEEHALGAPDRVEVKCVPVRCEGEIVALMTREQPSEPFRRPGVMERSYRDAFERFVHMISRGEFPYAYDEFELEAAPRVSDGVVVVGADTRIDYASPNAVSCLHRMGIHAYTSGSRLRDVGFDDSALRAAITGGLPVTDEIERNEASILLRVLPVSADGDQSGAVLLLRDVTDLRRRDRMLVSKDATIREIHHRVKNNLQTIASLLRIHGRRLDSREAREALAESERRIRSIAIVHETLSRDAADVVEFGDIVRPLVGAVRETLAAPAASVEFQIEGDAGNVPGEVATPLAVVVNELMQNAVDHAFGAEDARRGCVTVALAREPEAVVVTVRDDGHGLPTGFTLADHKGLGLTIVDALVTSELGGSIDVAGTSSGTTVTVRVPVVRAD